MRSEIEAEQKAMAEKRHFLCFFGPDSMGKFFEDIVTESDAKLCGDFCYCKDIKTKCLVGPDKDGNFATKEQTDQWAEECTDDKCLCNDHEDFLKIFEDRLNEGADRVALEQEHAEIKDEYIESNPEPFEVKCEDKDGDWRCDHDETIVQIGVVPSAEDVLKSTIE